MSSAVLSSALLERIAPLAFAQQLFQPGKAAATSANATTLGSLLPDSGTAIADQSPFFADLNTARAMQYDLLYDARGALVRTSANTVLVGYG